MSDDPPIRLTPIAASANDASGAVLDGDSTIGLPARADLGPLGKIGPYKLVGYMGKGGAGIVYKALDSDNAVVALKVMTVTPAMPVMDLQRFMREAETSKLLRNHPNIITVYDTGRDGQNYYIAMELVPDGRTLKDLPAGKLPVAAVLSYLIPIADALAYAHGLGMIHRDLKPANILCTKFEQPLLADFGLAKSENTPHLTLTGAIMGTPRYMSPEQAGFGDGQVTRQSDIYSFGLVVYELLVGELPYALTDTMSLPEVFATICRQEPVLPRKLRKQISRNLQAVLLKMLEKEKKLRYNDIGQVCSDLKACLNGQPVSVRRLSVAERWEKWLRRHASQAVTAAIVIATAVGIYLAVLLPMVRDKSYAKQQSDLSAVAAKRKTVQLEDQLQALRAPSLPTAADEGLERLAVARDHVAAGRMAEARQAYQSVQLWAEANRHDGLLAESLSGLGRLALANDSYANALGLFRQATRVYGRTTARGRLALFEAGATQWLQGDTAGAKASWLEVLVSSEAVEPEIDSRVGADYSCLFAGAMLSAETAAVLRERLPDIPGVFQGLGYWVLAQLAADQASQQQYLAEAIGQKAIFTWIGKETQHVQAEQNQAHQAVVYPD